LNGQVTSAVLVFAFFVLIYALFARGLARLDVTAPLAFVLAGGLLSLVVHETVARDVTAVTRVAEVTLALILFHDAAQVRPRQIASERGMVARLLLLGFPLTIALGFLTMRLVFPDMPSTFALLVAAALAPTDAGLGAATVLNPVVPVRIRRLLNVESGLNDGLSTPVVLFAIAAIAGAERLSPTESLTDAVIQLTLGVVVGTVVGLVGGRMLGWSRRLAMSSSGTRALGVLMLPILAYFTAESVGGNTFVSAFVAGTAFTAAAAWTHDEENALTLTETFAEPLGFAVWLVFGLVAIPVVWQGVGWREALVAVASLTVLRMGPVALALLGTRLRAPSVAFIGWFGPRGLASVIFALLALEELAPGPELRAALATIALTVLLSVIAHGLSADVLAARYGAWVSRVRPAAEVASTVEPRPRGSTRLTRS
jgi:sodium/hydrogen antiporter